MRDQLDVFHVAIPAYDLESMEGFYVDLLGCKLARRYEDRITLDFFGDQVVCHVSELPSGGPKSPTLYPRHFGVTFRRTEDFDTMVELCGLRKIPIFQEVNTRYGGRAEEHRTFVLRDPSDNLIEFKHYNDPRMMY
jgi:extradiol dioxygenase family protein